jgi:hypothetical protein
VVCTHPGDPAAGGYLDEAGKMFTEIGAAGWLRRVAALRQRPAQPDAGAG